MKNTYTVTYYDSSNTPVAWATHPLWPMAKEMAATELVRYMQAHPDRHGPFRIEIYPPVVLPN